MNKGDFSVVQRMTDKEAKELSAFVLLMWANGAQGPNSHIHVILTNTYCNPFVFSLSHHPKLLLMMLIAANMEIDNCRYEFRKAGVSKPSKETYAISDYYDCGLTEARQYKDLLTKEEIKEIVEIYEFKGA